MKHSPRAPFRSLRDLVLKELQREKSLLVWKDDPSFANEKLSGILVSEAYILDRSARDYLLDLASSQLAEVAVTGPMVRKQGMASRLDSTDAGCSRIRRRRSGTKHA